MEKIGIVKNPTVMDTMEETLLDIKTNLFDKKEMPVLVVGSLALRKAGFDVTPHDIDLEVILQDDKQEEIFKTLSEASGNDFHNNGIYKDDAEKDMENVTWKHKPYVFSWKGVVINVWVVSAFSHDFLFDEYRTMIAKPLSVLKKKLAYQRSKDFITFNNILIQMVSIANDKVTKVK